MRKIALILISGFAASIACFGQQSLYGGQQIISPKSMKTTP